MNLDSQVRLCDGDEAHVLRARLRQFLSQQLGVREDEVDLNSPNAKGVLDSLDLAELMMVLEELDEQ